jgi:hypothetical protein
MEHDRDLARRARERRPQPLPGALERQQDLMGVVGVIDVMARPERRRDRFGPSQREITCAAELYGSGKLHPPGRGVAAASDEQRLPARGDRRDLLMRPPELLIGEHRGALERQVARQF